MLIDSGFGIESIKIFSIIFFCFVCILHSCSPISLQILASCLVQIKYIIFIMETGNSFWKFLRLQNYFFLRKEYQFQGVFQFFIEWIYFLNWVMQVSNGIRIIFRKYSNSRVIIFLRFINLQFSNQIILYISLKLQIGWQG